MSDKLLTDTQIKGALVRTAASGSEEWLPDSKGRGDGRLIFRARPFGGFWIFGYTPRPGKYDRLEFGRYTGVKSADEAGAAYTLRQARDQAAEFAVLLKNPATRDIRAYRNEIAVQAEARRQAEQKRQEQEAEAARLAADFTLKRLLAVYVEHLRRNGKKSAGAADRALRCHIVRAYPDLAGLPAASLKTSDAARIVRKLIEARKGRMAGIVRSYARAAYALALSAIENSDAPADMIGFHVEHNPFTNVTGTTKYIRARKRTLNDQELRCLLLRLRANPSPGARTALLSLYAGGQRPEQVLEARLPDWDASAGTLRLTDRKGRRAEPRVHFVPLAEEGRKVVAHMAERAALFYAAQDIEVPAAERYLFPTRKTRKSKHPIGHLGVSSASAVITGLSKLMGAKEEAAQPFQGRDVRRTVENLLARAGVSKEIRGRLMSHGLSGVQDRHYVTDEFMEEKRAALEVLEARLRAIEAGHVSRVVAFARTMQGAGP